MHTHKHAASVLAFVFIIFTSFTSIFAAAIPDTTFGVGGTVDTGIVATGDIIDSFVLPDGKFIVAWADTRYKIARFNPDGSLDTSYGDGGFATGRPNVTGNAIALDGNGNIVVGGTGVPPNGESPSDFYFARHLPDGSLDPSFGDTGQLFINQSTDDVINSVTIQDDGKILGAGYHRDGGFFGAVFRLDVDGSLDSTFGTGGFRYYPYWLSPAATFRKVGADIEVADNGIIWVASVQQINPPGPDNMHGHSIVRLDSSGEIIFGGDGSPVGGVNLGSIPRVDLVRGNQKMIVIHTAFSYEYDYSEGRYKNYTSRGGRGALLPNGDLITNDTISSAMGNFQLISNTKIKGRSFINSGFSWDAGNADLMVMADGKPLVVSKTSSATIVFFKIDRFTSQGTRNVELLMGQRATPAVISPQGRFRYINHDGSEAVFQGNASTRIIPEYHSVMRWENFTDWRFYGYRYWSEFGTPSGLPSFLIPNLSWGFPGANEVFGLSGDVPVGGDFNGDGEGDITLFRPSNGFWYSKSGAGWVQWGKTGDKPVAADYDFDGITDRAIYRPSTGEWWVLKSGGGSFAVKFGIETDIPVPGDFDADGYADFTVFRPSEGNWYQLLTTGGFRVTKFGLDGDIPLSSDFDGDGAHDIAVYRAGIWHLLKSTEGYQAIAFGNPDDRPVTARYE
ncbi:MAG: hypothetical protein R2684_15895 [Pyrinomonadaceae bacterium]